MSSISVVIIAKNEAENIVDCITCARLVSDDVIVADSGSEDNTPALAVEAGARLLKIAWKGYGATRNAGAGFAKNDWILALDADERVTPSLADAIHKLSLKEHNFLYGFKLINFLGSKQIRFGEWGNDKIYRLYNRQHAAWDLVLVHEKIIGNGMVKKKISGVLLHYTSKDLAEYQAKTILYAQLSANKYKEQGKKASFIKRFISPVFSFVQNYFFRLGFLDGKEGLIIASTSSKYNYLKYKFLHLLLQKNGKQ